MERVNYDVSSGIYIDTCADDGVWCDAGELERLEAWIEANHDKLAALAAALQEGGEVEGRDAAWEATAPGLFGDLGRAFQYWKRIRGK